MEAYCAKCDDFRYDIRTKKFRCQVDGGARMASKPCNLKDSFKPHPQSIRDFEKEIADAEAGSSGVYEGVQRKESPVLRAEPEEVPRTLPDKEGDSGGTASEKLEEQEKPVEIKAPEPKKKPAAKKKKAAKKRKTRKK